MKLFTTYVSTSPLNPGHRSLATSWSATPVSEFSAASTQSVSRPALGLVHQCGPSRAIFRDCFVIGVLARDAE